MDNSPRMRWRLAVLLVLGMTGCALWRPEGPAPEVGGAQVGIASWYGPGFHGRQTASGERYDQWALTAAHPTLPIGTHVRVTSLTNGRSVEVRINDRGPFVHGRIIDLSRRAAQSLRMIGPGLMRVRVVVVTVPRVSSAERDLGGRRGVASIARDDTGTTAGAPMPSP